MKESNQMLKIKQYTHQYTPLYDYMIICFKKLQLRIIQKNLFVETIFY